MLGRYRAIVPAATHAAEWVSSYSSTISAVLCAHDPLDDTSWLPSTTRRSRERNADR
jgi:hypothetical protein